MRAILQLSSLIALTVSHPAIHPPRNREYINEMLDLVDSGMNSPAEGRALFVSITLTSTSTAIATVTVDQTVSNSCVAGTFMECTTTTTDTATTTATDTATDTATTATDPATTATDTATTATDTATTTA